MIATPNQPQIISDYLAGKSSSEIARKHGVTPRTILNILAKNNIRRRTFAESKMFNVPVDEIVAKFDIGTSISSLAIEYGYTITGMSCLIKRAGRIVEPPKNRNTWPTFESNPKLFLYLLGWLLTDGCVNHRHKDGRNRGCMLYISTNDECILDFFHRSIAPSTKRTKYPRIGMSATREYIGYVKTWGVIQRKSLTLKPTQKLNDLSDDNFLQLFVGCVEGDGSIATKRVKSRGHIYDMPQIGITTASLEFILWIRNRLELLGFKQRKLYIKNGCKAFGKTYATQYYNYRISGSDAKKLHETLTSQPYHLLDRKWCRI